MTSGVETKPQPQPESSSEGEGYLYAANTDGTVERPMTWVRMNNKEVCFLVDSGSPYDVIDKRAYQSLGCPKLSESNVKLFAYANDLSMATAGEFTTTISANKCEVKATVRVAKGKCGSLLSFYTSRALGLFESVEFKTPHIANLSSNHQYGHFMDRYPRVFTDKIGKLKDFEVKLTIDPSDQADRK